jgi:vacuolar-type H+-ATPase subunit E/Vma4
MGEHELREALRNDAQARIRDVWQVAEAALAERRAVVARQVAALREEAQRRLAATVAEERRTLLAAATLAARQQQLAAEAGLLDRLKALALRLLPGLCGEDRRRLWLALANELPAADWERIVVHPDDLETARLTFPMTEIVAAVALAGGLVAETAGGRVVVDNSLAGRLKQGWPGLQTALLAAVYEEVDRDAAGPTPAG